MSGVAIQGMVASDARPDRSPRAFAIRITVTTFALVIWFWTQSLIGARGLPGAVIGDRLHHATAPMNLYLNLIQTQQMRC